MQAAIASTWSSNPQSAEIAKGSGNTRPILVESRTVVRSGKPGSRQWIEIRDIKLSRLPPHTEAEGNVYAPAARCDIALEMAWVQALDQGTTRSAVAAAILGSIEADTLEVEALYNQFLRRPAESTGLSSWVNALHGGLTREDLVASILGSDEYYGLA